MEIRKTTLDTNELESYKVQSLSMVLFALFWVPFLFSASSYKDFYWFNYLFISRACMLGIAVCLLFITILRKKIIYNLETYYFALAMVVQGTHGILEPSTSVDFYTYTVVFFLFASIAFKGKFRVWVKMLLIPSIPVFVVPLFFKDKSFFSSFGHFIDKFSFTVAFFILTIIVVRKISAKYELLERYIDLQKELLEEKHNQLLIVEERLEDARKQIVSKSKLAAIGETTAMLAHDVRKPFSQIKSLLSVLNQVKDDPSYINKAIQEIERSVKHVESMLSDVMDFSREVKLDVESVSIVNVIELSLRQLTQLPGDKVIKLKYSFSNKQKLMADQIRLSRVFINIISNAIDAVGDEGLISFACSDVTINNKKMVQLVIANSGPFIQQDDLQKIFDPFFTKNKSRGTGLGLASAKKIVVLHEGNIGARNNTENKTVEFIITIPGSEVVDSYSVESLPESLRDIASPKSKNNMEQLEYNIQRLKQSHHKFKILLLEDEPLYRAAVRNTIKQSPALSEMITIYDAKSYDEAVVLVGHENLTHAIIDVDLGGEKNGFDFLKDISTSNVKIESMIHSNRHLDTFRQKAFELGAKSFVPKPLTLENLLDFLGNE